MKKCPLPLVAFLLIAGSPTSQSADYASVVSASNPKCWFRFENTNTWEGLPNSGSAPGVTGFYGSGFDATDFVPSFSPGMGLAIDFNNGTGGGSSPDVGAIQFFEPIPDLVNYISSPVNKTTTLEFWFQSGVIGSAQNLGSPSIFGYDPIESAYDNQGMYWGVMVGNQNQTYPGDFTLSTRNFREVQASDVERDITDTNNWHHVVMTKIWRTDEDSTSILVVDGGRPPFGFALTNTTPLFTTDTDTNGVVTTNMWTSFVVDEVVIRYLGHTENASNKPYYVGLLDEVAIYTRELTQAEIIAHYQAGVPDTDEDGIPDYWEDANGLDKNNPADADQDIEPDGAKNREEYLRSTDPRNPDTDGDGAPDGPETGTGIWVSSDDRGTDPLEPDTDQDGLLDGVESNSGTFVDVTDTGTNPLVVDTDADRFKDGDEVIKGTNPTDPGSAPALPSDWVTTIEAESPVHWFRFELTSVDAFYPEVFNQGSMKDIAGDLDINFVNENLGKTSAAPGLGMAIEFPGPEADAFSGRRMNFMVTNTLGYWEATNLVELVNPQDAPVEKATTVEFWYASTNQGDYGLQPQNCPVLLGTSLGNNIHWGYFANQNRLGMSTDGRQEVFASGVVDGEWHHVMLVKVWKTNGMSPTRMYVDGGALAGGQTALGGTPTNNSFQAVGSVVTQLGVNEGSGHTNVQYVGYLDEVIVYDRELTETDAFRHYAASGLYTPPVTEFDITSWSAGPGSFTLTWDSAVGASYTVQRKADLAADTWDDLVTTNATEASTTYTDGSGGVGPGFYRVRAD